jgi:hypothetical protein
MGLSDGTAEIYSRRSKRLHLRRFLKSLSVIFQDSLGAIGFVLGVFFIVMAFLAPVVAPYGPFEVVFNPDKTLVRLATPN